MTTAAQVEQLVRPLLARNPHLVSDGRFVFLTPVRHVACGIFVDRHSWKEGMSVWFGVVLLADPHTEPGIAFARSLLPLRPPGWDSSLPTASKDLCEAIEARALPLLRSSDTIEGYIAFGESRPDTDGMPLSGFPAGMAFVHAVNGDLDGVWDCADRFRRREPEARLFGPPGVPHPILDILPQLAARGDRKALAAQLHAWEAQSVRAMRLERYWEPSPFPLELT